MPRLASLPGGGGGGVDFVVLLVDSVHGLADEQAIFRWIFFCQGNSNDKSSVRDVVVIMISF